MKLSRNALISALAAEIALAAALSPQLLQKGTTAFGTNDRTASQHFTVIPNSVSSSSTFQVRDGRKAITVSLCCIQALEQGHPQAILVGDRLQGLLDKGNSSVVLISVTRDGRTQMAAESFILLPDVPRESTSTPKC